MSAPADRVRIGILRLLLNMGVVIFAGILVIRVAVLDRAAGVGP
jgi:hypothetical protein